MNFASHQSLALLAYKYIFSICLTKRLDIWYEARTIRKHGQTLLAYMNRYLVKFLVNRFSSGREGVVEACTSPSPFLIWLPASAAAAASAAFWPFHHGGGVEGLFRCTFLLLVVVVLLKHEL